jgi:hypothetical protein
MKSVLEKISWKTRNLNFKFRFLDVYLHDEHETWGFEFFTIQYNFKVYSLLAFLFRLPNKTHVYKFTIDDWDFLFLERFLYKEWETLDHANLWSRPFTITQKIKYKLLNKIYR